MSEKSRSALAASKRIVVKVGTNVVMRPDRVPAISRLATLVEQLGDLKRQGLEPILVTSGSVGIGAGLLGFEKAPRSVVDRQACAAAGQGALVALYTSLMEQVGCRGAQVLLTEADFVDRSRYLNLHHTLERLLELGVIPIINENDTVSTLELAYGNGEVFGDNDRLSALVASRLEADLLVLFTDVDGVFTAPPGTEGSELIPLFDEEREISTPMKEGAGRGGMGAKIAAARVAAMAGVSVVIANGANPERLTEIIGGGEIGTLFPAKATLNSRKRWLAFATSSVGTVVVNEGARRALVERRASLLPTGVVSVTGDFSAGDVVSLAVEGGGVFARGVSNFSATQARASRGRHTADLPRRGRERMVVHSENLVILEELK